ncbi:MAG: hypothetical protein U1F43_29385 [Myxococcota bacterium]
MALLGAALGACGGESAGADAAADATVDAGAEVASDTADADVDDATDGSDAADATDAAPEVIQPTCFVDFPCEPLHLIASCDAHGDAITRFHTVGCEAECGDEPCSGGSCRAAPAEACPDGTACVEPVLHAATCRPLAETCGGPAHAACGDGERCIRRSSSEASERVCAVSDAVDDVGFCASDDGSPLEDCAAAQ